MATVTVDSGELPSAKGKNGYELNRVLQHWGMIADGRFEYDCRALLQMIDEVDELRLWEYAHGGLYKTRDEFLEKAVLIDFDLTETSLKQIVGRLRGGEKFGLSRLGQHGGDRRSQQVKGNQLDNINLKLKGGTQSAYLRARLARDHPDVLAAYERGEFPSIRAAAIDARIVKVPTPLEQLRKDWKKASPEERQTFREEIQ